MTTLAEEVAELKAEIKKEFAELKQQIRSLISERSRFVDSHGVKWKREARGKLEELPYCPKCRLKMRKRVQYTVATKVTELLVCECCGHPTQFDASSLDQVRADVRAESEGQ